MLSPLRIFIVLLLISSNAMALLPKQIDIKKPPPKVIRTCCAFGVDVKVMMLPFIKMSSISAPNLLGDHHFLGNKLENNGIIYTQKGGFIDLGHLRDIADMTAYLYALINENKDKGLKDFKLGREGGLKTLTIHVPKSFNDTDIVLLAGKIAYDISAWHEISTWFGASSVPFVPERYSSFSVEDAYSNLLGVHLAMAAILSHEKYEDEMSKNINLALHSLGAVESIDDTKNAMLKVKDIWWSSKAKFPNRKILMLRQFDILNEVTPFVLDEDDINLSSEYILSVPDVSSKGWNLNDLYDLKIKYNLKIPIKKIFGHTYNSEFISQNEFATLVDYARTGQFK